ncbi:winged helix-turn-helix domain-containing protein [Baaleninema simplex]|uniref:winged helix-turn-helix domain-containing protein n=1 Tax=Baaleninema simplex TaxID=2862350 RepID=UPI0035C8A30C
MKCGYSWQRPRPKHEKGNKEEQEQFKKDLPLKVKKLQEEHPNSEVQVCFFDEHRVGLKPIRVHLKTGFLTVLKQISSPNQAKTRFVSGKQVSILVQPCHKTKRHGCPKSL